MTNNGHRELDLSSAPRNGGPDQAARIVSELVRHLALALGQYVRRLHRDGLRAPGEIEELATLLADLARVRQGAPGIAADRLIPPALAGGNRMAQGVHVPDRLLVTKKEAAERLSVSVRTIERLVATGMLPQVQIGRLPRFRVRDLEDYVQGLGQQQQPQSDSEMPG